MNDIEQLRHRGTFAKGDEPSLRWGVLGTGFICDAFANAAHKHTSQRLAAVGSRTPERAAEFASTHEIERSYGSYSAVIDDPNVDAIYVGVTADDHRALALEAIAAGKPVLVEKPFAMNSVEAADIRDAARAAGVLAMEAMWTRYLPQSDAIRLLIERGELGEIQYVSADHGQAITVVAPGSRLENAALGGGALLDLGVYPLAFASEILGTPAAIVAHGNRLPTGVDGTANMLTTYAGTTAQAQLSTTMCFSTPCVATICGTAARIELAPLFFIPSSFTMSKPGLLEEPVLRWRDESGIVAHEGLCYQTTALARYVGEGRSDSPILGLDESVSILATLDDAASQIAST